LIKNQDVGQNFNENQRFLLTKREIQNFSFGLQPILFGLFKYRVFLIVIHGHVTIIIPQAVSEITPQNTGKSPLFLPESSGICGLFSEFL
jgi:hypothetical protein